MRKLRFKLLMFLFCPLFFLGAMAQGTPPPGGGTGGTGSESGKNDYTQGLSNVVTDLSSTLGVDLFEEDIDNVVFSTNAFLCNSDFSCCDSYEDSWKFIKGGKHSLERYSNLGLCFLHSN